MASFPNMCVAQPPTPKGEQVFLYEVQEYLGDQFKGAGEWASDPKNMAGAAEKTKSVVSPVAGANRFARMGASHMAFRRHSWLTFEPVLNKSGNLRGMVVSKQFRKVFTVTSVAGKFLRPVGMILEVGKEWEKLSKVYSYETSGVERGAEMLAIATAAVTRSLASTPHQIGYAITKAGARLYTNVTNDPAGAAYAADLEKTEAKIDAKLNQFFDGEMWYDHIEVHLK